MGRKSCSATSPAELVVDDYRLTSRLNSCQVSVLAAGKDKVALEAKGALRRPEKLGPEVDFTILHTFYNDGVVVSFVKLVPHADFSVQQSIAYQLPAAGEFSHYLHKRRDEQGDGAARGRLPEVGGAVRFSNLTSCLSVFSPTAALAIFTRRWRHAFKPAQA